MDTVLILLEDVMDPNVTFKLFIVDIENDAYVQPYKCQVNYVHF